MNKNSRIFDFLQYQLERFPKSDMLSGKENGRWVKHSTAEIKELVDNLSTGLLSLGVTGRDMNVEHQDKIAIISRNRPEWIVLDLACQQIGAILCPVYPTTNPKELEFIFNDAAIKYVFVSGQDILDKVNSIREHVPSLVNIYSFDRLPGVEYWKKILNLCQPQHFTKLRDIKNSILTTHCATIIYTSGTTGTPKGVMLSHRNIVMNLINSRKTFPFKDNVTGRALSFLPLNHIFERMVTYIYITSGVSIYYAESMDTIADNLREVKPSIFCTVPRLLEKVYEKIMAKGAEQKGIKKKLFNWAVELGNRYDNKVSGGFGYNIQLAIANKLVFSKWREALGDNVKTIVTGSAACQVRLLRIFTAAKIPIYEGYGPTENSPVISVNCQLKDGTKFGTVGLVIKGQQIKLEADGEICVKGPSVMMGYYKNPKLTAETIIDGWLHTGDIGVLEDGKYLKITDRKKELFKTSGGKYVAPQPIENKMKESPFIEQMMVVGADEKFVGALIVPSINTLKEWMKTKEIPFTTIEAALDQPKVIELYDKIVEKFNGEFNHVEQVKKFELLPHEWTIETGELTPTLKLKRKVIMAECKDYVNKIYHAQELIK
ncbi:MAG TPA: long-chain fatty acid--CoA ligase [Ferruginibacter sp.]|jgi:long-chain acyl-CoA synthetase|nr:long-chain fatty acid--CoA ligase [Ferruginibacter sp.]